MPPGQMLLLDGRVQWVARGSPKLGSPRPVTEVLPPLAMRSQSGSAAARAAVRAVRAGAGHGRTDYLKRGSVSAITVARYEHAAAKYVAWALTRRRTTTPGPRLDADLAAYANHLFFMGRGASEARYAIWGLAWVLNFTVTRAALPQVTASLRGWARAAPDRANDPMPFEAMILLAHTLVSSANNKLGAQRRAAARILPLQWDLYMRPSEALQLRPEDCFAPLRDRTLVSHQVPPRWRATTTTCWTRWR